MLYKLSGDPKKKNGEKLLRTCVTYTPEWRSYEERIKTAAALIKQGDDSGLVDIILSTNTPCLRKHHLLHLCRIWGYQVGWVSLVQVLYLGWTCIHMVTCQRKYDDTTPSKDSGYQTL